MQKIAFAVPICISNKAIFSFEFLICYVTN